MSDKSAIITVHEPVSARDFLARCRRQPPFFVCTIASTETALIPGVSAAGASIELIPYTAAADVEAIAYGRALCLGKIPENPLGPPSPVIITMAALRRLRAAHLVVDAGNAITPKVPLLTAGRRPGLALTENDPDPVANAAELFLQGIIIGEQLGALGHTLILGESVPGGTTTAMAVMEALGLAALGKISGSMPGNNQSLKQELVSRVMADKGLSRGSCLDDPLLAVRRLGDPMQAVQAGMALSASVRVPVILGGGTQMIAVAALLGALLESGLESRWEGLSAVAAPWLERARQARIENLGIATTAWVSEDENADLRSLMRQLPRAMPLYASGLDFSISRHHNLTLYEEGYVKEGVGAGALALAALLYDEIDNQTFLPDIERVYEEIYVNK